jgi:hypothetical protein
LSTDNDNILSIERPDDVPAAASSDASASKLFPLDWRTMDVKLKGGRFVHELRRPTPEEIFAREDERQREIPIAKDNTVDLPDPTEGEEIDAELYDKLIQGTPKGYKGTVPTAHKAAAFNGLYVREIYIDEETDVFAEEVPVLEEIGSGDEADATIVHTLKQPEESELKRFRRRSSGGKLKPGKRGRQNFVPKSNLREAVDAYDRWCIRIDGVKLIGLPDGHKPDLLELKASVDPLIKRMVVQTLVDELAGNLLD